MSQKQRRTVTLDPEVDDYLDRNGVNASELVNELVKKHMGGNDSKAAMLQLREKQLESELATLENQREVTKEELQSVKSQLSDVHEEKQTKVNDAIEAISGIRERDLSADNPGVIEQAEQAGVDPEELIRRYKDRDDE